MDIPEDLEIEIKIEPGSPSSPPGFFEEPAPLVCSVCEFDTLWLATFIRHVKEHNEEKLYPCNNIDDSVVNDRSDLNDHCDAAEEKPPVCDDFEEKIHPCDDLVEDKFNPCNEIEKCNNTSDKVEEKLDTGIKDGEEHVAVEEKACSPPDEVQENTHTCDEKDENLRAEEKADDDAAADEKVRTPTKKSYFNCKICKYKCRFPVTFHNHMRTKHTKAFDKIHKRTPILDSPRKGFLTCNICSYTATGLSALGRHISTHQSKDEDFKYTCHICDYNIVSREDLIWHFKIHLSEGHASDQTEKSAEQSEEAPILAEQNHLKQDDAAKKYFCTHCKYWSHKQTALASHYRQHKRGKPLSCELCDYKCTMQWKLRKHHKRAHGENPRRTVKDRRKLPEATDRAARTMEAIRKVEMGRYPLRNGFSNIAAFLADDERIIT